MEVMQVDQYESDILDEDIIENKLDVFVSYVYISSRCWGRLSA